jgi:peptidoglycan lytic transglycosylase
MKRTSFRTAQDRVGVPGRRLVAGVAVLMTGLALTASAKDLPRSGDDSVPPATPGGGSAAKTASRPTVSRSKAQRWLEVGTASWYGLQFQGRRTAGGESFDMNGMTCAHPSLPMGTWLKVTNLKNRKTAFVRVNDRGPVVDGRIVDLSAAAARTLGLVGLGKVKLEAIRDGDAELAKALVAQVQNPGSWFPWAAQPVSLLLSPR